MKREDITKAFPDATKEQIDALMAINGADITKAKGELDKVKADLAAAQQQIEAAKNQKPTDSGGELAAQIAELTKKISNMEAAETIRATREKVAKETGIPANLLTGETEDDCTAQAQSLNEFIKTKAPGYPSLHDGGDPPSGSGGAKTRDQFAEAIKDFL